jgi:starch phosphorylase
MTYIALNLSDYVNGVAKKHGEISRLMFASHTIDAITNGVYAPHWVSGPFHALFDKHIPHWREDNFALRSALSIPADEIWDTHLKAKKLLFDFINQESNNALDLHVLTIGFGRRAASYKRADLLFHDVDRLRAIVAKHGKLQIIYAGKAHPKDMEGKALIKRIFQAMEELKDDIKIVYLPNYDLKLARLMTAGTDVWLNTPRPPMEASGTSGMKAALNGVPSLSVLDGWWIEGCIEGITGWSVGCSPDQYEFDPDQTDFTEIDNQDAASLYDKLEYNVFPIYYQHRDEFIKIMQSAIALNGSFFNTHRMVQQYALNAYLRFKALTHEI